MEQRLGKVAFVVEELGVDTPAQQLLDRFLIGYPRDGESHRPDCKVHIWLAPQAPDGEVRRRTADFGLQRHETLESAVASAEGIVLVPKGISAGSLLGSMVQSAPPHAAVFAYGALADSLEQVRTVASRAAERQLVLACGTSTSVTWRLPDIDLARGTRLTDALIVVQGDFPAAELHALDGLLPLLERRRGGESGVRGARFLQGDDTWRLLSDANSARPLLAAALSRSDSPQGDPVRDGRTQNLMALGLVPKLARNPRAWLLDHNDGLRTTLIVLDGVVGDFNFALRAADGRIFSAQLYRPPAPQRHEFSRLARIIENYFRSRAVPWPVNRSLLIRELLDTFSRMRGSPGE